MDASLISDSQGRGSALRGTASRPIAASARRRRHLVLGFLLFALTSAGICLDPGLLAAENISRGLVPIETFYVRSDPAYPWRSGARGNRHGNALVIAGQRLLTTANLVRDARLVLVRRRQGQPTYPANITRSDREIDLALLRVDDPRFWRDLQPLAFAEKVTESFWIRRWSASGHLEQGRGELLTYQMRQTVYGDLPLLMLNGTTNMTKLGAAELLSNAEDQILGLVLAQGRSDFHALSARVLHNFASEQLAQEQSARERSAQERKVASSQPSQLGRTAGDRTAPDRVALDQVAFDLAHLGFSWQPLENPALRADYGLRSETAATEDETDTEPGDAEPRAAEPGDKATSLRGGVRIQHLLPSGVGSTSLQPEDVLLRLGPYAIGANGEIDHAVYGRLPLSLAVNETMSATLPALVLRQRQLLELTLDRQRHSPASYLVPPGDDQPTPYAHLGGLIMQNLTRAYLLRQWGGNWRQRAPTQLILAHDLHGFRDPNRKVTKPIPFGDAPAEPPVVERERIVFVSAVLSDALNLGYANLEHAIVVALNGRPIRSVKSLTAARQFPVEGGAFHLLQLKDSGGLRELIFPADTLAAGEARIRHAYQMPR